VPARSGRLMSPPDNSGESQGRDRRGRWHKGTSGNPSGPPAGSRHRTTRALESLLDGEAEGLTRKAVELALAGDTVALRLCLERLIPPRKDRPVVLALPPLDGTPDLPTITAALLMAAAAGELTPGEAGELAKLVEAHRRAIETADLERRLAALEAEQRAKTR
jgi:Family of unknown function (DUF5681)